MAKKQMTFEQKVNKGHSVHDKFVKIVCSSKSEKQTWKFSEKYVRIPEGQDDNGIITDVIKKINADA
ncbi:hypothetical protein JXQ31_16915 [candidate division KSB1 bacterium]|nr:hypothetical protein [candidate division KSB1 bacterium]